jgi:undecaprenyl-diphosphatase
VDAPPGAAPTAVVAPGERGWTWADTRRVVAAGGTLVIGGLIAREGVPELERDIFEIVNGLPSALYGPIWVPMQIGSLAGGLIVASALGLATRRRTVAVLSVGAVVAAWMTAKTVKDLVQRARPGEILVDVVVHDSSGGLGYVSGHATVAFALYTMAAPHLRPRWRPVALGLATFVGLARIYSGAHLPLDVVGGAALGMLVGEAFRRIESVVKQRHRRGFTNRDRRPASGG